MVAAIDFANEEDTAVFVLSLEGDAENDGCSASLWTSSWTFFNHRANGGVRAASTRRRLEGVRGFSKVMLLIVVAYDVNVSSLDPRNQG